VQPDVLFISCCGFTVERTLEDLPALTGLPGFRDLPAVRQGQVFVADGSRFFSSPGPELVDSLEILAHALDPAMHPLAPGHTAARQIDLSS
jgi:iron complex transport system substrate-binding protein